jgi:hypothetical protein
MLSRLHSVKAKQKLKTISQHICKLEKQMNIENILIYFFFLFKKTFLKFDLELGHVINKLSCSLENDYA